MMRKGRMMDPIIHLLMQRGRLGHRTRLLHFESGTVPSKLSYPLMIIILNTICGTVWETTGSWLLITSGGNPRSGIIWLRMYSSRAGGII